MSGDRRKQSQRIKASMDMIQAPIIPPCDVMPEHMPMTEVELMEGMGSLQPDEQTLPEQLDPFSHYWRERIPTLLEEMNTALGHVSLSQEKSVQFDYGLGNVLAAQMCKAKPPGNIGKAARLSEAARERIAKATFSYRSAIGKKAQAAGQLKKWNTKIWQLDRELKLFEALLYVEGKRR